MEGFARYLETKRIFGLICCVFWIFSPAEGTTISQVAGSRVILHCISNGTLSQLTWKLNGTQMITFKPYSPVFMNVKAKELKMNISLSEDELYALVIETAQTSHTGNYSCQPTTSEGTWELKWELIITVNERPENWNKLVIPVAVTVPCVCFLIFIIAWIILRRIYNQQAENSNQSHIAEMQPEDIYENCLEINARQQQSCRTPHQYKPRAH